MIGPFARNGRSFSGRERNCCFLNSGEGWFADISTPSGLDFPDDGRAACLVDWDFDGDLDLWLANRTSPQVRLMRNDFDTKNRFLALRLQGTTCNRDAIGARVEVHLAGAKIPLIRTLRAGEGYLAQSSKWVHFGLGDAQAVERLVVRWPGGEAEEFAGAKLDGRYQLVQGSGRAELWTPPSTTPDIKPSTFAGEPTVTPPRVFLARRTPLPELSAREMGGGSVKLSELADGQPALVVLWASWCRPCLSELAALQKRQKDLEAAGLKVVLLCVDGLSPDGSTSESAAETLAKLEVDFPSLRAVEKSLDLLQIVHDETFERRLPLGVPTSILVDPQWRMAAMYRGGLDADAVLADAGRLPLSGDELVAAGLPFPGRWHELSPFHLGVSLVRTLVNEGFEPEAAEFITRHRAELKGDAEYGRLLVFLGDKLFARQQYPAAAARFQEAIEVQPTLDEARFRLATVYEQQSKIGDAVDEYRVLLEPGRDEGIAGLARRSLAWVLATTPDKSLRDPDEAVELAELAAQGTGGEDPIVLQTLAAAYAAADRFEEAVEKARAALRLAQAQGNQEFASELESNLQLFESRKAIGE
jgi:tetratricopeptide (TPR) repeat protein